jgi:hypothetical protein
LNGSARFERLAFAIPSAAPAVNLECAGVTCSARSRQ